MKLSFLVTLIFFVHQSFAQNWQQLDDFPGVARDDGASFTVGDTAYFGTGLTPWWAPTGDFFGFDLSNETWFSIASLPTGSERQYATAFASSTHKGFLFGGHDGANFLNDLWTYDPSTDSWQTLSPLPSTGRGGASCFVFNDTAYIVGGKNAQNQALDEVWAYSISSDTWIQKNNFPFGGRWRSSATTLNNFGYLLFGKDENEHFQNELFAYDPMQDSWTQISTFPSSGRSHAALFSMNSKLFASFGLDSLNHSHNDLWSYDLNSDLWQSLPGVPTVGRRGGMSISTQNGFYYVTGIDEADQRLTEVWKYHPSLFVEDLSSDSFTKTLIKVVDLMGRETTLKSNEVLIYIYSDGTTEKVFQVE